MRLRHTLKLFIMGNDMYLVKYASSGIVAARFLHRIDAKDFILNNDDFTLGVGLYIIEKEWTK